MPKKIIQTPYGPRWQAVYKCLTCGIKWRSVAGPEGAVCPSGLDHRYVNREDYEDGL